MPKIIGISGCSRSGKSNLAKRVKEQLENKRVLILDMDEFVFSASKISKIKDRTDWERPESVDFEQLYLTIKNSSNSYDVIVVEGILVFANSDLLKLMDATIWIQLSKETFLSRRKEETRWGKEPVWFLEHVWESHLRYGQYPKADFVLSGEEVISLGQIQTILEFITT